MVARHRIHFPPQESTKLGQDETFFYVEEDHKRVKLRFHDYDEIYRRPGLYEQLFYDRLKCTSPQVVGDLLKSAVEGNHEHLTEQRVLDFGAGNGMVGEVLKQYGTSRMVGADIIEEAKLATERDRPGIYDEYYITDFTDLPAAHKDYLAEWRFDCMTCVAALGFGDIPPDAFLQGVEFIRPGGWLAFNIKESFLNASDTSGFSRLIRELIFSEHLDIHQMRRYRHRLSMEGQPLFYFALVVQKRTHIPQEFVDRFEL